MSQSVSGLNNQNTVDFHALARQLAGAMNTTGGVTVPGSTENLAAFMAMAGDSSLPALSRPATADTTKAEALKLGTLSLGGLSLETLMDAVGMEQRRTETKAGMSNIEARAQEREQANAEKLKQVQEEIKKLQSRGLLDKFLQAFKYIGMVLAAVASVAMIATGAVGLAAGGSGAALIAVGVASLYMLTDSIVQEATDGKVGIGLGFAAGKIAEAAGGSESAVMWTKFAVDLAASIALMVASFGAASGKAVGDAVKTGGDAVQAFAKVAGTTAKVATVAGGVNTMAQGATSVASAVNERDIANLQAEQKKLQAILERIAQANELDMEHIKAMMERTEQTLQTVSDIVEEGVATNTAIMTGAPSMA